MPTPVARAQFLQSQLGEFIDQRLAVIRREWPQELCPRPHVSPVLVAEDARHFGVAAARQFQDAPICLYLRHVASVPKIDLAVNLYLTCLLALGLGFAND